MIGPFEPLNFIDEVGPQADNIILSAINSGKISPLNFLNIMLLLTGVTPKFGVTTREWVAAEVITDSKCITGYWFEQGKRQVT